MMKLYLKRAGCILGLLAGFVMIYKGLDYALIDDTKSESRVSIHEFYDQDKIDILFAGPSHSVHMIDAVRLSDQLDCNVFNMSTKSQNFKQGEMLLRDAIEKKGVKKVYYEASISRLGRKIASEKECYLITDYMPLSWNKARTLLSIFPTDKYINSFFRLRRETDPLALPKAETLDKIRKAKDKKTYKTYAGDDNYLGKGQCGIGGGVYDLYGLAYYEDNWSFSSLKYKNIKQEAWDSVADLIDLCKKNDVELTFYIPPYSEPFINDWEDYYLITDAFAEFCKEKDVPLIDLNLAKPEYLDVRAADYYNMDHLKSSAGKFVADFFTTYINDPSGDYFYSDYEERFPKDVDRFIGISYDRTYMRGDKVIEDPENSNIKPTTQVLTLSATSYQGLKADIRIYEATYDEPDDPESVKRVPLENFKKGKEIEGKKLDDRTVEIVLPYTESDESQGYFIEVSDPDTHEVKLQAYSILAMQ